MQFQHPKARTVHFGSRELVEEDVVLWKTSTVHLNLDRFGLFGQNMDLQFARSKIVDFPGPSST